MRYSKRGIASLLNISVLKSEQKQVNGNEVGGDDSKRKDLKKGEKQEASEDTPAQSPKKARPRPRI